MTPRLSAAPAALVTALLLPAPAAPQGSEQDPRPDLHVFEAVLDRAVSQVSRASLSPFFPGIETCHGYHLPGYGAMFVVSPRALPRSGRPLNARDRSRALSPRAPVVGGGDPLEPQPLDAPSPAPKAGPVASVDAGRPRPHSPEDAMEYELQLMQQQVDAFQKEAEDANRLAEEQLDAIALQLRLRMKTAGSSEGPGESVFPAAGGPEPSPRTGPPGVPAPPWRFWSERIEPEDRRTPNRVLNDVRTAVTEALESAGPRLRVIRPEEFLVVAVDFVASNVFGGPGGPQQTLVVRVKKKDLDDRAAGRIASDELQKRIEYMTY